MSLNDKQPIDRYQEKSRRLKHLCETIIKLNKQQRIAFLSHISKQDCKLLQVVSYNILTHPDINISAREKRYFNYNIGKIKKLASSKVCHPDKRNILVKKHLLIKALCKTALRQ